MTAGLTALLASSGPIALLVLCGVLFAETGLLAGFFLPGDSLLFTAGVLVAGGALHLPLWLVALAAVAAAAAGNQVGYLIGARLGPRLLARERRWLPRRHVQRADALLQRHGARAVVLARFVPVVRTLAPVAAGALHVPRRRFATYNLVGATLWAGGLTVAGYLLGGVPVVSAHLGLLAVAVVALSVLPAVARWLLVRARSALVWSPGPPRPASR